GDVFVAESNDARHSENRITLLRDTDGDGLPDKREVFLDKVEQPFGMLIPDNYFYVACVNQVRRYPYQEGQTKLEGTGEKIMDLPKGGYNHHWTRNIIASPDQSKLYVSVGSA